MDQAQYAPFNAFLDPVVLAQPDAHSVTGAPKALRQVGVCYSCKSEFVCVDEQFVNLNDLKYTCGVCFGAGVKTRAIPVCNECLSVSNNGTAIDTNSSTGKAFLTRLLTPLRKAMAPMDWFVATEVTVLKPGSSSNYLRVDAVIVFTPSTRYRSKVLIVLEIENVMKPFVEGAAGAEPELDTIKAKVGVLRQKHKPRSTIVVRWNYGGNYGKKAEELGFMARALLLRSFLAVAALEAEKLPELGVWLLCYDMSKLEGYRAAFGSDSHVHVLNAVPKPAEGSPFPFWVYALNPVLGGCAVRTQGGVSSVQNNVWVAQAGLVARPLDELFEPALDATRAFRDLPRLFV